MKKINMGSKMMEVIDEQEYERLSRLENTNINDTCIEMNGLVLPIQKRYDGSTPGVFDAGVCFKVTKPENEDGYTSKNVINFDNAKDFAGVIETHDKYRRCEEAILTTKDNISKVIIKETNQPELVMVKEMINAKGIDMESYGTRLGPDKDNVFRLVKDKNNDNITLNRSKTLCEIFDCRLIMRIEDKPGAVNPMGIVLEKELTMGE